MTGLCRLCRDRQSWRFSLPPGQGVSNVTCKIPAQLILALQAWGDRLLPSAATGLPCHPGSRCPKGSPPLRWLACWCRSPCLVQQRSRSAYVHTAGCQECGPASSARHADTGCISKCAYCVRREAKLLQLQPPPCTARRASPASLHSYTCTHSCAAAQPRRGSPRAVTHLRRTSRPWPVPLRPFAEARREPHKLDTPKTGK